MAYPNMEFPRQSQLYHHDFVRNWTGFDSVGVDNEIVGEFNAGFREF